MIRNGGGNPCAAFALLNRTGLGGGPSHHAAPLYNMRATDLNAALAHAGSGLTDEAGLS